MNTDPHRSPSRQLRAHGRFGWAAPLRRLLAAVVFLALTTPGLGETGDLSQALSGDACPLNVKPKELDSGWRRFTVRAVTTVSGNVAVNVTGNSSAPVSQNNLTGALAGIRNFVTRGQTIATSGRTYLVAYHLPGGVIDPGALLQMVATKTPSAPAVLTPETALPLALLDLATVGSLEEIRAFDMEREIADTQKGAQALADLFKSQSGDKTNAPPPAKNEPSK